MKPCLFVIDNFDSFTYNLVEGFLALGANVQVYRNDLPPSLLEQRIQSYNGPKALILSPGPHNPKQAGFCLDYIHTLQTLCPIFGICLGHQVISEAFGGTTYKVTPCHGQASVVETRPDPLFSSLPSNFKAGRYHSLASTCPDQFDVIARTQNITMAFKHKEHTIYGLQFHPESILTEFGETILNNILSIIHDKGVQDAQHP